VETGQIKRKNRLEKEARDNKFSSGFQLSDLEVL